MGPRVIQSAMTAAPAQISPLITEHRNSTITGPRVFEGQRLWRVPVLLPVSPNRAHPRDL